MRVYSIFSSINGEICYAHQGSMCTFIRLAGCSIGCKYCDTKYAADPESGREMGILEISSEVYKMACKNVTITGGEPMEQLNSVIALACYLQAMDCFVSIETSGEVPFSSTMFPERRFLSFVVDMKLDGDNRTKDYLNMNLSERDFLKIVIGSRDDMQCAVNIKKGLQGAGFKAKFAFSPMEGKLHEYDLLKMMEEFEQTDSILSVQLHKILRLQEDK